MEHLQYARPCTKKYNYAPFEISTFRRKQRGKEKEIKEVYL